MSDAIGTSKTRFELLDPVRGFAAIWVFLYHYQFSESFQNQFSLLHSFCKLGDRAVPLFFVVSGYCIALTATRSLSRTEGQWTFIRRRLWRIFPTFWCSIVVILLVRLIAQSLHGGDGIATVPGLVYPKSPRYNVADWFGVATLTRSLVTREGLWWARFSEINGAYWTLALEMQFYIVVGLLLRLRRWFWVGLTAVTAISFVCWFRQSWFVAICDRGLCLAYWSWFSWGLLLYYSHDSGFTPQRLFGRRSRVCCTGLLAVFIGSLVYCSYFRIVFDRQAFAGMSALAVWCLLEFDGLFAKTLASPKGIGRRLAVASTQLGAASYTIYLTHIEVASAVDTALRTISSVNEIARNVSVISGTTLICFGFYFVIEKPFLRRRRTTPNVPTILPFESVTSSETASRAA